MYIGVHFEWNEVNVKHPAYSRWLAVLFFPPLPMVPGAFLCIQEILHYWGYFHKQNQKKKKPQIPGK